MKKKLPRSYYLNRDVVALARDLIGKVLVTTFEGGLTSGIISEAEAYNGEIDRASHAYNGRRTSRTETMYSRGGMAYVYLCYGIHHLFNVVTNEKDIPHAVLVRSIIPLEGPEIMARRRNVKKLTPKDTCGPGKVSQALGIFTHHSGLDLTGGEIWIEDRGIHIAPEKITTGKRIGVDYAGEDAHLPYRFYLPGNRHEHV